MFQRRFVSLYLALCAVTLVAVWTAFAPGLAPAPMLGWILAGMFAVYAVAILLDRATRPSSSVAQVLEAAARANAARTAAPPVASSGDIEDPRR